MTKKLRTNGTTIVYVANGKKRHVSTAAYNESRGPTVAGVYPDERLALKRPTRERRRLTG